MSSRISGLDPWLVVDSIRNVRNMVFQKGIRDEAARNANPEPSRIVIAHARGLTPRCDS